MLLYRPQIVTPQKRLLQSHLEDTFRSGRLTGGHDKAAQQALEIVLARTLLQHVDHRRRLCRHTHRKGIKLVHARMKGETHVVVQEMLETMVVI